MAKVIAMKKLGNRPAPKLAAVALALAVVAFALGQTRIIGSVSVHDPIASLHSVMGYLFARMDTLERSLADEVKARKALEKEVVELKKAREKAPKPTARA